MGLVHNRTETQCNWVTTGLVHIRAGTQWAWYTIELGHNGPGTHWDWDMMELGHKAPPLPASVERMWTCKRSVNAHVYVFLLKEVRVLSHDVGQVTLPDIVFLCLSLDHFV